MANQYLNEYSTIAEMNAAYEEGHDESWVAYCAEDNNIYYQQKTKIASKYFDNLEYNSETKNLEFYIDGDLKKTIDVSPWWFEKDSYYTREESDAKYVNNIGTSGNNVTYSVGNKTSNITVPYASSVPWSGVTGTPTTRAGYGITDIYLKSELDGVYIAYWDTSDSSMSGQNSLLYMCNPKKWQEEDYNNKSYVKPIGVAFSCNGYRRIVALSGTTQYILPQTWDTIGPYTRDFTTALNQMDNGLAITSAVCTSFDVSTDYAFGYCWNYDPGYSSKRANSWYLPTLGELWLMYINYNKLNYALSVVDGAQTINGNAHHCSTRCIGSDFWSLTFYNGVIHGIYNYIPDARYNVRPITIF